MIGCTSNGSTSVIRRILLTAAVACLVRTELPAQWLSAGGPFGGSVVALASDSQYVYLGTTQGHVWRRPVSELVTGIRVLDPPPRQSPGVNLASYPNPCNASTVFTFSLPRASRATLVLYDILGRNVMTVLDRRLEAGSYQFPLEMTSLSSGIYVAVLNAGEIRVASRIALVR